MTAYEIIMVFLAGFVRTFNHFLESIHFGVGAFFLYIYYIAGVWHFQAFSFNCSNRIFFV